MNFQGYIKYLTLRNIKGISSLQMEFERDLTIVIGRNGSGKTTVLDSLAFGLEAARVNEKNSARKFSDIFSELVRDEDHTASISITIADVPKMFGEDQIEIGKGPGRREMYFNSSYLSRERADEYFPPLIYYAADRAIFSQRETRTTALISSPFSVRSTISNFTKWFEARDAQEAREIRDRSDLSYRDPELDVIRNAVRAIDGVSGIRYRDSKLLLEQGGRDVPVDGLSSGERSFFILLVDLSRRLLTVNRTTSMAECRGIVLIDEVDLHLHPEWQHRIIKELTRSFINCQFILATHSPQIVGAASAKNIRVLDKMPDGEVRVTIPKSSRGRDANYLLEGVFGSHEREPELDAMFDRFEELVLSRKFSEAESVLDSISDRTEGSSSAVELRRVRLDRARKQ